MVRFSSRRIFRATELMRLRRLIISIKKVVFDLWPLAFELSPKTKDQRPKTSRGNSGLSQLRSFVRIDLQLPGRFSGQAVGFIIGRIRSVPNVFGPARNRIGNCLSQVRILADEARQFAEGHADQIMKYQNLNIAMRAGPNADRRKPYALGNHLRDLARD